MESYWDNGIVRLFHGDARDVLAALPAESCHVVVTSPP
jgi:DNA modification methylase